MNNAAPVGLAVPLTTAAKDLAQEFAAQQSTPEKGLRVYLNTLAVWAVHRYLQWLQIESNLLRGDSWQPQLQALLDVADLHLPGFGKLECRPFLREEKSVFIPPEGQTGRIGYLGVRFGDRLDQVELLGFTSQLSSQELRLEELQPLEKLLDHLEALETEPIQLQAWLENIFTSGWQAVEELLIPPTPSLAFRSSLTSRGKVLPVEPEVVLLVSLMPEKRGELAIRLQLRPNNDLEELPLGVQLQVLTEEGEVFRQLTTKPGDRFLQYEFSGRLGEKFSVQILLGEESFTRTFVV